MDKLKALYESYINGGILSSETTFEQFSTANPELQDTLYKQGVDNKVLSDQTDLNMFKSAWGLKKKKTWKKIFLLGWRKLRDLYRKMDLRTL